MYIIFVKIDILQTKINELEIFLLTSKIFIPMINYEEEIILRGILSEKVGINQTMIKYKRLPSVIDLSKNYETFEILTEFCSMTNEKLILVKEEGEHEVKILLRYKYFTYKEVLERLLPKEIEVPHSFQIVGTILHINLSDKQMKYKEMIGQVLLDKTNNIETVITKIGQIDSEYRFCKFEVIAGKNNFKVLHLENNIKYFIDYEAVYWNSKLQAERIEFLKLLNQKSVICDPFCGVGPNVLPAAKRNIRVYCNDLNLKAIECLNRSIEINKICINNIFVSNQDAKIYLQNLANEKQIKNEITHFIFNLPEYSLDHIKYLEGFNDEANVVVYFFCKTSEDVNDYVKKYIEFKDENFTIKLARNVSPSKKTFRLNCKIKNIYFNKNTKKEDSNVQKYNKV